jgi:glycerol-3-phosphate dehydrogenase
LSITTRHDTLARLSEPWDMLIIGGGIAGAGILLEAARRGLRALLVEQRDFAWGTSSRSSKLVHGGLRYLAQGQIKLTRESVHERQALLREAPGLVEPQSFVFPDYKGRKPGRWLFTLGLIAYDQLAGVRSRAYYRPDELMLVAPHIATKDLKGGMRYLDAKTDDARLVLRVLQEAQAAGGVAINYAAADGLLRENNRVVGATVTDCFGRTSFSVRARVVVNATGAWADRLRGEVGAAPKLRPLRGSHLLFPFWRLPVAQAVSLMHPWDERPVFIFPWEGAVLVGTTDLDHSDLQHEAAITPDEVAYLMAALVFQFPHLDLTLDDVLATYAGVRPVVSSGKTDPSQEGRDHVCWLEDGLLTVTGGKLTTFRLMALDALKRAAPLLPDWQPDLSPRPVFAAAPMLAASATLSAQARERLTGRYGAAAPALIAAALPGELEPIGSTDVLWVELRWAARAEAVLHIEDLLLRRTRLGLLLRHGGAELLPRIRPICQPELGWTDAHWEAEEAAYREVIQNYYSLPARATIPDWKRLP